MQLLAETPYMFFGFGWDSTARGEKQMDVARRFPNGADSFSFASAQLDFGLRSVCALFIGVLK